MAKYWWKKKVERKMPIRNKQRKEKKESNTKLKGGGNNKNGRKFDRGKENVEMGNKWTKNEGKISREQK